MTELENYIKSYFGVVQSSDLNTIASMFKPQSLNKGDYFLKTGQSCNMLSFIKSGFIRIYVSMDKGEITQWISGQGYFVTDLSSLIFESPARFNMQALTDVELYTIERKEYLKIGQVVHQWHELEKFFIAKCFNTLEERIFSHLSMTSEERYHYFFENNKALFNQVPLQYIASLLGMTPETFSRIRKKHTH